MKLKLIAALVLTLVLLTACGQPAPTPAAERAATIRIADEPMAITTSGAAGSAAGAATTAAAGEIYAIYLDYAPGISSTTDLILATTPPAMTLLTKTNFNTDTWLYPVVQETNAAGAGTGTYRPVYIEDTLTASLAQTTAAAPCLTITILFVR